jgi:hypothetical protein
MTPALLTRAAECIERQAAVIAESYTMPPDFSDWTGADKQKAEHDAMMALAAELRAAVACPHAAEPRGCYRVRCQLGGVCVGQAPPSPIAEPVATLHDDGCWTWKGTPPHESNFAGWRMDVYAAPVAQALPAEGFDPERMTTAQLLTAATKDSDPVSVFAVGSDWNDTDRAILVVKGRENIRYLHAMLVRQGLLTEGKAVES